VMPEYAHQTSPGEKRHLQRYTGNAVDSIKAGDQDKRDKGEYLVCGRIVGQRKIWDVYRYQRGKNPMLVGKGFAWPDEALAFVRDRKKGRITVGWKGLNGRFRQAGRLLVPSADIDTGKAGEMQVRVLPNGDMVV